MRIILDMDGVLTDFHRGVHNVMGWLPYDPQTVTTWSWFTKYGATYDELADRCDYRFWANLPWMPDGQEILGVAEEFCPAGEIILASAPMRQRDIRQTRAGKEKWVFENLGDDYVDRLFVTPLPKRIFATGRDAMLIDDKEENCIDFRAAGGSTILVPAPYNSERDSCGERVAVIRKGLERWATTVQR